MTPADVAWIQKIVTVDLKKVGQLINEGMHHRVYEYGHDEVIKIPKRSFNFLYSRTSHLEKELQLLETFFPGLAIRTTIHASVDQNYHCMIQERVKRFTLLDPTSLTQVTADFNQLLLKNYSLRISHNCSLDLLGGEGVMSCIRYFFGSKKIPHFSNTVLVKTKGKIQLRLIDTELLRLSLSGYTFSDIISWVLSHFSVVATKVCLRYFL